MFRAHDPDRDRIVAVKQFTLDLPLERLHQLVALFERLIAADLNHHVIAAPIATGLADGAVYLAQESVSAESLDHAVREYGPAPTADAVRVATELAGALDFAAVVDILHGTLHPRDVLLASDTTRLTGIGIARALEQIGVALPLRRPYTAPERITGASWDRRADIYSLAVLVHDLLWGRRLPAVGAAAAISLSAIPGCDMAALQSAFARAIADDPGERFDTALAFAEALKDAFNARDVSASSSLDARGRPQAESRLPFEAVPVESAAAAGAVTFDDLDLLQAEEERYADVGVAPATTMSDISATEDAEDTETIRFSKKREIASVAPAASAEMPPVVASDERPPSRIGPLFLMLGFGVTAGLAAGYIAWSRPNPVAPPAQTVASVEAPKLRTPSGREFTETTVPEPPKAPDNRGAAPPPDRAAETAKAEAARETSANAAAGRLLVRSTPSGATVLVDGREEGETPVAVRDLSRGTHRVRLVHDGYAPAEQQVVITASRPAQSILVTLSEAHPTASHGTLSSTPAPSTPATIGRFSGDVVVESKPSGAKVYFDNKLAGTTPLSLPQVSAGSHVVRLEREGYRRWSAAVRVVAAERNRITASLER